MGSTRMVVGIAMACVGSTLDAIGFVAQKKGHNRTIEKNEINEITDEEKVYRFVTDPMWVSGFLICITGSILNTVALRYAPQSTLAPLRSITLVANAILATRFLGERLGIQQCIGILLVIVGSVGSVLFGPTATSGDLTIEYIKECWANSVFLIFFGSLTGVALIDYLLVRGFEHKNKPHKDEEKPIVYGANFLMISYVFLAAYFGSLNMLFSKSLVTILGTFGADTLSDYFFYINIVVVVVVNIVLEFFRQRALYYFDAVFVVPIFSVLLILGINIK